MSINGLWTAEFSFGNNSGTGIVVLLNGQILGGDTNYYYTGWYSAQGEAFTGELLVAHYAGPLTNLFGPLRQTQLKLEAAAGEDLILGQCYQASAPLQRMSVKLKRVQRIKGAG